jgi:chromosome partitioning protein
MIVIAVTNSKGGVGKTTLASALAVRAAQESKRVAMVDLDPQRSLVNWWTRRGKTDNPTIFEGADNPADAREALELDGWDWVFMDSPPGFYETIEPLIKTADFVLIPLRGSLVDVEATEDTVGYARDEKTPFMCVLNDVGEADKDKALAASARKFLTHHKVPTAETQVSHRASHIDGMAQGKSAPEIKAKNGVVDKRAIAEIEALWLEVKTAAQKAARAKRRRG